MLLVIARQRPQTVRAQELVLVEHAGEDPAQLSFVEHGQHAPSVDPRVAGVVDRGEQLWHRFDPAPQPRQQVVAELHSLERQDRRGAQRQEPDHRTHLEPRGASVRQAEHVVEEPVLLVPQLIVVVADPVHRRGDEQEVLCELEHHVLVDRVVRGELERDPEHALREERHPRRAVRLLEMAAGRQRRTAVEHADVVQAEEPALEHVAPGRVLAVDPPREVDQQLLERALQPRDVARAALLELGLVHGERRPRVDRRVDVAEVPLVGRQLPARVEVQLAEHQLELSLGVVDVDHRQRDRVERQIPRRVPRVLPRVGHRDHVLVDHVEPVPVADVGASGCRSGCT